jgi:hypothetical protein
LSSTTVSPDATDLIRLVKVQHHARSTH